MPNVLRAVEHAERQAGEKVARRQIAGDGAQLEAGFALQKGADILQLGQIVLAVATVLDQLRPVFHVLGHRVQHVEAMQFAEYNAPFLCEVKFNIYE